MGPPVGMLVTGCNYSAALSAGFIWPPTDLIRLFTQLHLPLVLVPRANSPNGPVLSQLFLNIGDVARVVRLIWTGSNARKDEKQAPEGTSRLYTKVTNAMRTNDIV